MESLALCTFHQELVACCLARSSLHLTCWNWLWIFHTQTALIWKCHVCTLLLICHLSDMSIYTYLKGVNERPLIYLSRFTVSNVARVVLTTADVWITTRIKYQSTSVHNALTFLYTASQVTCVTIRNTQVISKVVVVNLKVVNLFCSKQAFQKLILPFFQNLKHFFSFYSS